MGGKFITLEGGEGTGKSTQIKRLATRLREHGIAVHVTREPGGSESAERIRELLVKGDPNSLTPMSEALLMTAARVEHVERIIKPKLAEGTWVVSDRFYHSTLAYQGFGHGLGHDRMMELTRLAIGSITPDLTLMLDLPVSIGMERALAREGEKITGEDRFEKMDIAFHERLRQGFLKMASGDEAHCAVINANADMDAVEAAIWTAVQTKLGL